MHRLLFVGALSTTSVLSACIKTDAFDTGVISTDTIVASSCGEINLNSCDSIVTEISDEVTDISVVSPPHTICGSLESVSNDGVQYTGDRDIVSFQVSEGGSHDVCMAWNQPASDYDLYLYAGSTIDSESSTIIAYGSTSGGDGESFNAMLEADTTYSVVVVGWTGPVGEWGIKIQ